jgi:hypothetical protein
MKKLKFLTLAGRELQHVASRYTDCDTVAYHDKINVFEINRASTIKVSIHKPYFGAIVKY